MAVSSARVVKCWVRDPQRRSISFVALVRPRTQGRLPVLNWRKVGMTSSHHSAREGYTRATIWRIQEESDTREQQRGPHKCVIVRIGVCNSTPMKSGNRAGQSWIQECHGEYVPRPCTPPVTMGVGLQKEVVATFGRRLPLCDS